MIAFGFIISGLFLHLWLLGADVDAVEALPSRGMVALSRYGTIP
jgi:hypothetical protein